MPADLASTGLQMIPIALSVVTGQENSAGLLSASASGLISLLTKKYEANISEFVHALSGKLQNLNQRQLDLYTTNVQSEEGELFFATAWWQAADTIAKEKVNAIASLVKNSLTSDELKLIDAKWLLRLVDEIDEVELIILQSYTQEARKDTAFIETHASVLEGLKNPHSPVPQLIDQQRNASPEELNRINERIIEETKEFERKRERHSIYLNRTNHLVGLGLLGEAFAANGCLSLTPLGAALLKIVDLLDDEDDFGRGEQFDAVGAARQARQATEQGQRFQTDLAAFSR